MAAPPPGGCRRTRLLYQPLSCRLAHLECGGLPSLFFHPQLELHSVVTALTSKSETNPSLAVEVREHRDPGSASRAGDSAGRPDRWEPLTEGLLGVPQVLHHSCLADR